MKKIIYSLMIMAGLVAMPGCNDDFMEHSPKDSLTEETVFSTYSTFKTYAWGLYNVFTNGNMLRRPGTGGSYASAVSYQGDINAGYLMRRLGSGNSYAFQTITDAASGNGWNFSFVRNANLMLDNIDNSSMSDVDKEHWRSVGYFFRAYYYMELMGINYQ